VTRTVYLLEFPDPIDSEPGASMGRGQLVFTSLQAALVEGEKLVRQRFADEPPRDIETSVKVFKRERGSEYYCGGVCVKPVEMVEV
jgi:hypothetical protein